MAGSRFTEHLNSTMSSMSEANAKFSLDFYRKMRTEHPTDNLLCCPVNLSCGLGLLLLGSECNTASELKKVLHWDELEDHNKTQHDEHLMEEYNDSPTQAQDKIPLKPHPEPQHAKPWDESHQVHESQHIKPSDDRHHAQEQQHTKPRDAGQQAQEPQHSRPSDERHHAQEPQHTERHQAQEPQPEHTKPRDTRRQAPQRHIKPRDERHQAQEAQHTKPSDDRHQAQEPEHTKPRDERHQAQEPQQAQRHQAQEPQQAQRHQAQEPQQAQRHQAQEPQQAQRHQAQEPQQAQRHQAQEPQQAQRHQAQESQQAQGHQAQEPQQAQRHQAQEPQQAQRHQAQEPQQTQRHQAQEPQQAQRHQAQEPQQAQRHHAQEPEHTKPRDTRRQAPQRHIKPRDERHQAQEAQHTKPGDERHEAQEPHHTERHQAQEPHQAERHQAQEPHQAERHQAQEPQQAQRHQAQEPQQAQRHHAQEPEHTKPRDTRRQAPQRHIKPRDERHQTQEAQHTKPSDDRHQAQEAQHTKPRDERHQAQEAQHTKPRDERHQAQEAQHTKPRDERHQAQEPEQAKPRDERHQAQEPQQTKPRDERHQAQEPQQTKPSDDKPEASQSPCSCSKPQAPEKEEPASGESVSDDECEKPEGVHTAFSKILAQLNRPSNNYILSFANKLYGDYAIAFLQKFLYCALKLYWTEVDGVDFHLAPEEVRRLINLWTEVRSHGKIKDVLPKGSVDCLTELLLVNSVYFKGLWDIEFKKELTEEAPFFTDAKAFHTVQLMHTKGIFNTGTVYLNDVEVQVLEIPYKNHQLSMFVLLPTNESSEALVEMENALTHEDLLDWSYDLKPEEVEVAIPKFSIEKTVEADKYFDLSLLNDSEKADFSGATTTHGVALSQLVHDTFFEVDEQGGVAPVTKEAQVSRRQRRAAVSFIADHPFLFYVRHNCNQSILILGRFSKPE